MMACRRKTMAFLLIGLLASAGTATADDVAAQVRAAKDAFRPLDQSDVAAARAELDAAVDALEARFSKAGESAEGWKAYLKWDALREELPKPGGPGLPQLKETFVQLSAGHEGLALVPFRGLRDAIRLYLGVAIEVDDPKIQGRFAGVMDSLANSLDSFAAAPNGEEAANISTYLAWLRSARQTPDLIEAVRSATLDRNFYGNVSVGLLNAAMGRDVDDTAPVRDNILGTSIHGTGRTTGKVTVELVPTEDRATIMTVMKGTNVADTVGYNGPVVIHSDGTSDLTTQKQIFIDGEHLWTSPARADAVVHSHIRSIRARNGMRLIENIAWKRARRQKCKADAIAAQHAEQRVSERFDEEVDELIGTSNDDLQKKVRGPLLERGVYPAELQYSTDVDFLNVSMLQAGALDLGATTSPPEVVADADLRVRVHESMINNFTSGALAGMLIREERMQEAATNMLGELPKELESEEGALPWGISFQAYRPVWVAFSNSQFTISIRGRSFYEGDTRHPGMDVTVTYKIVGEGDSLKAVRQGEVQIFPPGFDPEGDKKLSAEQAAIRRILQRRLGKKFEEEIIPEDLVLPNEWSKAGKLRLVQWEARDGWLALSWKRTGEPAPAEAEAADVAEADADLRPLARIEKVAFHK
jgi:hypothetical protein